MNIFKDIYYVNSTVIKKTGRGFVKNWPIIFSGFLYTFLNLVLFSIINYLFRGFLNILVGFAAAIISSSLISNYLYLLYNVIKYDRINLKNVKEGFSYFLWKVYGIFFIAWILNFLLGRLGNIIPTSATRINIIINLLILIIFNPLPEIVYQKSYSSWESITYSFDFMRENWLNWLIPNILFFFILYKLTGNIISDVFMTHIMYDFDFSIKGILNYLFGQLLFSFFMIYRGYLFELLSTSTMRKRMYMKKLND
ncbi:MAG: DUF624 domain-containing protein [Sporanaerobacter sp.]|uniref:hypothetical protein n=1 Tax=Sporanaerobacter sp. TaxID=2010183 RepID=UPI003A100635